MADGHPIEWTSPAKIQPKSKGVQRTQEIRQEPVPKYNAKGEKLKYSNLDLTELMRKYERSDQVDEYDITSLKNRQAVEKQPGHSTSGAAVGTDEDHLLQPDENGEVQNSDCTDDEDNYTPAHGERIHQLLQRLMAKEEEAERQQSVIHELRRHLQDHRLQHSPQLQQDEKQLEHIWARPPAQEFQAAPGNELEQPPAVLGCPVTSDGRINRRKATDENTAVRQSLFMQDIRNYSQGAIGSEYVREASKEENNKEGEWNYAHTVVSAASLEGGQKEHEVSLHTHIEVPVQSYPMDSKRKQMGKADTVRRDHYAPGTRDIPHRPRWNCSTRVTRETYTNCADDLLCTHQSCPQQCWDRMEEAPLRMNTSILGKTPNKFALERSIVGEGANMIINGALLPDARSRATRSAADAKRTLSGVSQEGSVKPIFTLDLETLCYSNLTASLTADYWGGRPEDVSSTSRNSTVGTGDGGARLPTIMPSAGYGRGNRPYGDLRASPARATSFPTRCPEPRASLAMNEPPSLSSAKCHRRSPKGYGDDTPIRRIFGRGLSATHSNATAKRPPQHNSSTITTKLSSVTPPAPAGASFGRALPGNQRNSFRREDLSMKFDMMMPTPAQVITELDKEIHTLRREIAVLKELGTTAIPRRHRPQKGSPKDPTPRTLQQQFQHDQPQISRRAVSVQDLQHKVESSSLPQGPIRFVRVSGPEAYRGPTPPEAIRTSSRGLIPELQALLQ
eukprot:Clim_evm39s231 gene=Clim_evmTU39s231